MFKEFKQFALRGNVMDLAIAVIIGGAFGRIVASLVEDILMPLIGVMMGGVSFAELQVTVGNAVVSYGLFIQSIVDFLIIAFVIFMLIRAINNEGALRWSLYSIVEVCHDHTQRDCTDRFHLLGPVVACADGSATLTTCHTWKSCGQRLHTR